MNETRRSRGPWMHRFVIGLLSVVLAILVFWLLGFILDDIGALPGPVYQEVEKRHLDQQLVSQQKDVQEQIADLKRNIDDQRERQRILSDSTAGSQRTMNQLLEFQRLNLEKGVKPSADEQQALAESQTLFLANQKRYQALNEDIATLTENLRSLEEQRRGIESTLAEQRPPAREEYNELRRKHNIKMAFLKLLVLVPLLLIAVVVSSKKRGSIYVPIIYAAGLALVCRVFLVMHEYFPRRYFKYILLLALLAVVLRILVYFLRMIAFPKKDWLLKQYKEAHERFCCPVCGYPIRRGPLKYAFWTRRTAKKLGIPEMPSGAAADEVYTCPACGSKVYEECESCHSVRHAFLPYCEKCGAEKSHPAT